MLIKLIKQNQLIFYLFLSIIFALTVQQFPFYKGNSLHLIHAIKNMDFNKLQFDWIANQTNHLPLFTYFNLILIKYFSVKILYLVHFILLVSSPLFLFLICKNIFKDLENPYLSILWFAFFTIIFHEHSFFGGLAGQDVINEGYQPASYGVLFFVAIYLFLNKNYFYAVVFISIAASFHPTYVLHSGFLMVGILIYFLSKKEFIIFIKFNIFYFILISPITIYIIYNFLLIDKNLIIEGSKILYERAIHHASIEHWFSFKDTLSLLVYFVALAIIIKAKDLFLPLFFFGFVSIILTLFQFYTENYSLGLSFPWRSSVFLIPISTMIIFSFLLIKIFNKKINLKFYSIILFSFSISFFFIKNHFIKNSNQFFFNELELSNKIKSNYSEIDRLLIPVNLENIRMNTGLPIFVDWKHPPFKYDEVIIWKKRINLASTFFDEKNFYQRKLIFDEINQMDKISHILIKKTDLINGCKNLINDDEYALIIAKECFGLIGS